MPNLDVTAWDDIAQEVLVKLQDQQTIRALRKADSPVGYLLAVIRNAGLTRLRRQRAERDALARLGLELLETSQPPEVGEEDRSPALRRSLRLLTAEERELLRLRFWKNQTIRQIATERGLPYSTVAVRMFRLIRRLREYLGQTP